MLSIQMKYISATVNGNSFIYVCYMLLVLICLLHINIRFIPLEPSKRERKTQRERERQRERESEKERERGREMCVSDREITRRRENISKTREKEIYKTSYISPQTPV